MSQHRRITRMDGAKAVAKKTAIGAGKVAYAALEILERAALRNEVEEAKAAEAEHWAKVGNGEVGVLNGFLGAFEHDRKVKDAEQRYAKAVGA